jgi:hypothetical protein
MKKSPLFWGIPLLAFTFLVITTGCAPKNLNSNSGQKSMVEDRTYTESFTYTIEGDPSQGHAEANCTLQFDFNRPENSVLEATDSITVDFEVENVESPWIFDRTQTHTFSSLSSHCGDVSGVVFLLDGHEITIPTAMPKAMNVHARLKPNAPPCESNHVSFSGGLIVVVIESMTDPVISLRETTVKFWHQGNATTVPRQN